MYLSGVNRGISFTKPGFYTTGMVVLLGFFATGSGYNGLFLALGFGLSFLLISGLLSEKTIQASELSGISDVMAEADTAFSVNFQITNSSSSWYVFSLENIITTKLPNFRLLQTRVDALIEARLMMLPPEQTQTVPGRCNGLPRGWYQDFYLTQRTLFPFGMISKFKVSRLKANISVLPRLDEKFAIQLNQELAGLSTGQPDEHEFYGHRPVAPHTPIHALDQKKNAGRPPEQWVMKVFEAPANLFGFWVDPDWTAIRLSLSEEQYEKALSYLRTACEGIRHTGKPILVKLADGRFATDYEKSLTALIQAPPFQQRTDLGLSTQGGDPVPGWYLRLGISGNSDHWQHHWDLKPSYLK